MIKNGTPQLKSLKNRKQKSRLGTASNKITGGLNLFAVDQPSPLVLLWFTRQNISKQQNEVYKIS